MSLGTAGEWKLYVVKKEDEPPTGSSKFTDYSDFVMDFNAKGTINELRSFEGTFVNINTTTKRGEGLSTLMATLDKGNIIYLLAGTKLVGKFVINKPVFSTDYQLKVTGVQSSGTTMLNRKLANENMPKIHYDKAPFCDILKCQTNNYEGILVDSAENTILCLSPTHCGGTDLQSAYYKYENRIEATDKLVNLSGKEWWIEHGDNDGSPFSDGDVLCVDDRQGASGSSKTFYVKGANMNASISEGAEEIETNVNHLMLEGQNQTGMQVVAETFDATGNYSCITTGKAIDGWLKEDISDGTSDPGCSYIPVTSDSFGSLLATGCGAPNTFWGCVATGCYVELRIDNERVLAGKLSGSPPCFTNLDRTYGGTLTEATPHKMGSDITLIRLFWSSAQVPFRMYVDCPACFTDMDNTRTRVGSEWLFKCCYGGSVKGANYINALRGGSGFWQCAYSHGDKILVRDGDWTPADPDNYLWLCSPITYYGAGHCVCGTISHSTGITDGYDWGANPLIILNCISGNFTAGECILDICPCCCCCMGILCKGYCTNSIFQCGLYSKTLSDNTAKNWHMLDMNSQRILLTKKLPIKRIALEVADAYDIWDDVDLGDTVTLGDGTELGFADGEEVRVTGFEFAFEGGFDKLTLYCNDKETRTYSSSDLNYSDEKTKSEEPKQQDPLLNFAKCEGTLTGWGVGVTGCWDEGWKTVKGVMSPDEDYDAANKKYVDAQISCAVNYWCCDGPPDCFLQPCYTGYDLLPCGVATLGRNACRWTTVWGVNMQACCNVTAFCCVYAIGCVIGAYIYGDGSNLTNLPPGSRWATHSGSYICPCSGCNVIVDRLFVCSWATLASCLCWDQAYASNCVYVVNWTCTCRLCVSGCIKLPVGICCF